MDIDIVTRLRIRQLEETGVGGYEYVRNRERPMPHAVHFHNMPVMAGPGGGKRAVGLKGITARGDGEGKRQKGLIKVG